MHLTATEWLDTLDPNQGHANLTSFCMALIWNDGVVPKANEDGRILIAIMKRVREEIDVVPEGIGNKCLTMINNQLAMYNTSLNALIAKDLGR